MNLHIDDTLTLMQLAGRLDLQPGTRFTLTQVAQRAPCSRDDAVAVLRFLSYLGYVACRQQPDGEALYQVTDRAPPTMPTV